MSYTVKDIFQKELEIHESWLISVDDVGISLSHIISIFYLFNYLLFFFCFYFSLKFPLYDTLNTSASVRYKISERNRQKKKE